MARACARRGCRCSRAVMTACTSSVKRVARACCATPRSLGANRRVLTPRAIAARPTNSARRGSTAIRMLASRSRRVAKVKPARRTTIVCLACDATCRSIPVIARGPRRQRSAHETLIVPRACNATAGTPHRSATRYNPWVGGVDGTRSARLDRATSTCWSVDEVVAGDRRRTRGVCRHPARGTRRGVARDLPRFVRDTADARIERIRG